MTPDVYVRRLTGAKPNLLVPHYLLACYAYYVLDDPLLTDATFEQLVADLKRQWADITHPHKHLILWEDLEAGTGYAIQYPPIIRGAALSLAATLRKPHGRRRPSGA